MRKGGATSYQEGRKISSEEGRKRKVVREGGRYVSTVVRKGARQVVRIEAR